MRKLYTTKLINRPEMKFYLVIDYTLPSTWLKSTQAEIQNDGGSLGLVISLKTRSRLSHLIKRESLMFSLRQYCLDFLIFTMIDSKFHFSPTFTSNLFFWTRNKNDIRLKHMTSSGCFSCIYQRRKSQNHSICINILFISGMCCTWWIPKVNNLFTVHMQITRHYLSCIQ